MEPMEPTAAPLLMARATSRFRDLANMYQPPTLSVFVRLDRYQELDRHQTLKIDLRPPSQWIRQTRQTGTSGMNPPRPQSCTTAILHEGDSVCRELGRKMGLWRDVLGAELRVRAGRIASRRGRSGCKRDGSVRSGDDTSSHNAQFYRDASAIGL